MKYFNCALVSAYLQKQFFISYYNKFFSTFRHMYNTLQSCFYIYIDYLNQILHKCYVWLAFGSLFVFYYFNFYYFAILKQSYAFSLVQRPSTIVLDSTRMWPRSFQRLLHRVDFLLNSFQVVKVTLIKQRYGSSMATTTMITHLSISEDLREPHFSQWLCTCLCKHKLMFFFQWDFCIFCKNVILASMFVQ